MTAKWPLPFALVLGLTATRAAGPTITIDTASPSGKVSPLFYGLMTEEINHAYDGGLYAELVRNRAFLDDPATPAHWSIVQADGSTATMALDPKEPLNTTIGTSLRSERHAGLDRSRGRYHQRGLLGHSGQTQHALPCVLLRQGRARIHRTNSSLDPERRRPDDLRDEDRHRSDVGLEAVRIDATDRQGDTHREGALRPDSRSPRHCLVQPGVSVPADVQGSAERIPSGHHADDGRHEAEVPAFPRGQLPRGRSDRRPVRVEEDDRSARRSPRAHGAVDLPFIRRAGPSRISAVVRRHGTPSPCWRSTRAIR